MASWKPLPIAYLDITLPDPVKTKLAQIIPLELVDIFLNHGVISGGSVLHALVDSPETKPSDIDIYVLNSDHNQLQQLVIQLYVYLTLNYGFHPSNYIFGVNKSIITIYCHPLKLPIQLILTDKTSLEDILNEYDLDYVQLGLSKRNGEIHLIQSTISKIAIDTKSVNFVHSGLSKRLQKAVSKGFLLPIGFPKFEKIEAKPWTLDTFKSYLEEHHYMIVKEPDDIKCDQIVPFTRRIYSAPDIEISTDFNHYRFLWNQQLNPAEHLSFLERYLKLDSKDEHKQIYDLVLEGKYQEAIVRALYQHRKNHHYVPVIPSVISEANKKSLQVIMNILDSLTK